MTDQTALPPFPITDSHMHLWDPREVPSLWLHEEPSLNQRHDLATLDRHRGPVEVERIVFVQAEAQREHSDTELEWVRALAQNDSRLVGACPWIDVEAGAALAPVAERHAADPFVVSVRRLIQTDPEPDACLRPAFVEGVHLLGRVGLPFELCLFHPQLASAVELVRRCPETRFILDHIGKPGIKDGLLDPWRDDLRAMAKLPNVWCKLSGMANEADMQRWSVDDLRPYIEHAVECFGVERMMFGGDWPVSTLAVDYPRWVETVATVLSGLSLSEQQRLYRDTATECYGLPTT